MTEADDAPLFKELDGGTLFMAQQYWLHTDDVQGKEMRSSIGAWPWESVLSVQTLSASVMPELPEPRCCIELAGQWLYLGNDFQQVLAAWRRWRRTYGGKSLSFTHAN